MKKVIVFSLLVLTVSIFAQDYFINPGTLFDFNDLTIKDPGLNKIDEEHYLCTYTHEIFGQWTGQGRVEVLNIDLENNFVSENEYLEFDSINGRQPVVARIDENHFLCLYSGPDYQGAAAIFEVDQENWTVSITSFIIFEASEVYDIALQRIGDPYNIGVEFYICCYNGGDNWNGNVALLNVDTDSWNISIMDTIIFEDEFDFQPHLVEMNMYHYFLSYSTPYPDSHGEGIIISVNLDSGLLLLVDQFEFTENFISNINAEKIDDEHILLVYNDYDSSNQACLIQFDTSSWGHEIIGFYTIDLEADDLYSPDLEMLDETHMFCVYDCQIIDGYYLINSGRAALLSIDLENNLITTECTSDFGSPQYVMGRSAKVSSNKMLTVYHENNLPSGHMRIMEIEMPGTGINDTAIADLEPVLNNYPNPFNPETLISFELPVAMKVELSVYNLKGQFIKNLVDKEIDAQTYQVRWDGRDENGNEVPSGIYFYKLISGENNYCRKMTLLK